MPVGTGASGATYFGAGSRLQFWGENIEGYDALLSGAFDFESAIGQYQDNSAVAACLSFIISAFSATTIQVGKSEGGENIPDASSPFLDLINRPHADYDGEWMFACLLSDYWETGNAYLNVVRSGIAGAPVELQILRAICVRPVRLNADDARLLDHYRYTTGSSVVDIPAEQVIHFRYSIPDPSDMRIGAAPLRCVRREVYTDNKASEVAAALMRRPQPSGFLMPDSSDVEVSLSDMEHLKRTATEASSGQNAGQVVGLSAGVKWVPLSFSPSELALDESRVKPEERICSIFNIPPMVVGLGAGLKHSTYNNGETAHRAAWQNCIAPLQDYLANVLTQKLLPMFPGTAGKIVFWDRSDVGVLQTDVNMARTAAREDYKLGIISVEEARGEGGRSPAPEVGVLVSPMPSQPATATAPATTTTAGAKSLVLKRPSASNGAIYDAADRFRAALLNDEAEAIQTLASAYNRVSRDIQKEIDSIIAELEAAPEPERIAISLRRANALLTQVEDSLADFADRGAAIIEDGQRQAVQTTLAKSESLVRAALGDAPPGKFAAFSHLPAEALETLIGMAGNGSPLSSLLEDAGKAYATELREMLVSGMAQGVNPREVARRMTGAGGKSRARMEAIARTEMLRASREASRKSYEENSHIVDGWIRLSAADTRTCAACWALHGTKSATSERFPQHPQCRCAIVPAVKSYAEILGDPSIPDTRPTIPMGEDIFAQLDESEQREILGEGLLDLYKGGASLSDFVTRTFSQDWGATVTVSTVASAAARAGVLR